MGTLEIFGIYFISIGIITVILLNARIDNFWIRLSMVLFAPVVVISIMIAIVFMAITEGKQ